ncbi:MAG: hypothetical protein KJI72_00335 [Patescibacteria group bacterium]|nr:hypothetical protein [Patescibacteria group bacterium]
MPTLEELWHVVAEPLFNAAFVLPVIFVIYLFITIIYDFLIFLGFISTKKKKRSS